MIILPEEPDNRQQEQDEHQQFLAALEQSKLRCKQEADSFIRRMDETDKKLWEEFKVIFGDKR